MWCVRVEYDTVRSVECVRHRTISGMRTTPYDQWNAYDTVRSVECVRHRTISGMRTTLYDQWNACVQHVRCTRRSLQYFLASDRKRTIKKENNNYNRCLYCGGGVLNERVIMTWLQWSYIVLKKRFRDSPSFMAPWGLMKAKVFLVKTRLSVRFLTACRHAHVLPSFVRNCSAARSLFKGMLVYTYCRF